MAGGCAALLEAIAKRAKDFDVIHSHIDWLPLPMLSRLGVPFVTTMHGRLDLPGLSEVLRQFPAPALCRFRTISACHAGSELDAVPHGRPSNSFRPSFDQGSYLAFLGRLTAEKGPQDAIRIARAAGMPLRIAAKIPRGQTGYFKKQVEPHIDGRPAQLVDEVDEAKKLPFLAGAAALLFPMIGRSLSARHDRGDGLRDASDRLPLRLRARGPQRDGLHRRERRVGCQGHGRSGPARQTNSTRALSPRTEWRESAKGRTAN